MPAAARIEPQEDWDLLFQAVLETVARVAMERPAPDGAALQLQAPGEVLCECIDALDRLRRSVPLVQNQRTPRPATNGANRGP